jgi:hypothetical protein
VEVVFGGGLCAVLEPEREEEQHDPHLAQGRDQRIVERRDASAPSTIPARR